MPLDGAKLDRRGFLKVAGTAGLSLAAACAPSGAAPSDPEASSPEPQTIRPAPAGILITPTGELYVQSFGRVPRGDAERWRLRVYGLVDQALDFSLEDLKALPRVESLRTLECIGNPVGGPLIGNVVWAGVEAARVWERVGPRPEAIRARFSSEDGYETSVERKWITQEGVLLAYEINGQPLPEDHGFPLRILMPGLYGQKMPKWLTDIEFIDHAVLGYWEQQGWSDVASVRTNSLIRQPHSLQQPPAGLLPVFGVAFAGLRRIAGVEVSIDRGEWVAASLLQDPSPGVWTQWSYEWQAPPGRHAIAVRARDETGFVQSSEAGSLLAGAFPDGTDSIHEVVVQVS